MVFIGVSRASRIDGNDDDDEEWSHMFVRLPPLPTDDDDDDSVAEGRSQPPDASAIEALFERGGPLHGKSMKARVAIASVGPRPGDYSIWPRRAFLPLPRRHAREKMFLVALVQALGFPDVARGFQTCLGASTERLYPDAVYESLKIAFECDEEQHYDDAHWFNRSKPDYHQRRRDRAVNVGYASQGYYVVRVMACDRRSRGRRYVPCSPVEVYARAAFAARQAVAIRERNYAAGDYAGNRADPGREPAARFGFFGHRSPSVSRSATANNSNCRQGCQINRACRSASFTPPDCPAFPACCSRP